MRDQLLLQRAREMRRKLTGPELRLWLRLRAKGLSGAKFRRQVVIGPFIADFACRSPTMLIVELDGETHANSQDYDGDRTRYLEGRGYRVMRFTNGDVNRNLEGVLLAITEAVQTPPLRDAPRASLVSPEGETSPAKSLPATGG